MEKKIVPVPSLQESPQTILNFLKFCVHSPLPDVTDAQMREVWTNLMVNNNKIIKRLEARKLELEKGEAEKYTRAIKKIQRSRIPICSIEQIQQWKLGKAVTKEIDKVLRGLAGQGSPLKSLSEDLLSALPMELLSHMDLSLADLIKLSRSSKSVYDKIMANPYIQIEEQVTYVTGMKPWLKKLKNIRLDFENLSSLEDIVKAGKVGTLAIENQDFILDRNQDLLQYISLLGNLPLHTLKIHHLPIRDISALANLRTLRILDLSKCKYLKNISALKNIPLHVLDLNYTKVSDISTLDVSNLYSLNISHTEVEDISVLAGAHKLHTLNLYFTEISDISTLDVSNLYFLNLSHTDVMDISVLTNAHKLHTLRYNREFQDVEEILEKIPSLKIFKNADRLYTRETNMLGSTSWTFVEDESD